MIEASSVSQQSLVEWTRWKQTGRTFNCRGCGRVQTVPIGRSLKSCTNPECIYYDGGWQE